MLRVKWFGISFFGGDQALPFHQMMGDERLLFAEGERTLSRALLVKGYGG
jgi:hypothetical protein